MKEVYIPKDVAKYIGYCKFFELSLLEAISGICSDTGNFEFNLYESIRYARNNQETFAMAWTIGYKVIEPKYKVRVKAITGSTKYLVYGTVSNTWYFCQGSSLDINYLHTKKELEDAGFSWVFNCEGIEITEVNNG